MTTRPTQAQPSELITVTPMVKYKGFKKEQLKIVSAVPEDRDILGRVLPLLTTPQFAEMPSDRQEVVSRVVESYERKLSSTQPELADYVLSGHELVEFKNLEDRDVLRYVFYRYKYNKFPEQQWLDDFPPCVQIEPSSICNYRCVMCYQVDTSFSSKHSGYMGSMSLELFKTLIDQLEGHVEAITLASRGEPLLNKEIGSMLEHCGGKFLGLKVNTNASTLNEKLCHALLSSDIQTLVFSIDAADRETYEAIRVRGKFDRVMKNMELFQAVKEKHYPDSRMTTRISGVKINDSQDMEAMEKTWASFADMVAFTNYIPWHDSYRNAVNDIEPPCTDLWRRMFVWQDGTVNPCDYDYKSILSKWNANDMGLSDIWISPEYNELRRLHLDKMRSKLEPCRRCIAV
jgi:organic radical activating enzyme